MRTKSSSLTRRIVELAWPVLIAQLSSMTQMVSDTVLAGRYGTEDLAAVAVASGIYISVVMLMVGILQAVAPTVAHQVGAGRRDEIGPSVQQGFWLAATAVGNALLFVGGWLYMHTPMWATWCVFVAACGMSMLVMLSMVRWLERVTK